MFIFVFGILVGIAILYKIGKKDARVKEKTDAEVEEENKNNPKKTIEEFLPKDINFSPDEIKKRQEKILGNLSIKEREIFQNFIKDQGNLMNQNKDSSKTATTEIENFSNNIFNIAIIFAIGFLLYYCMK